MPGLPRTKDTSRPQDAFALLVLGGFERLTTSLRRGDAFSEKALNEMTQLRNRYRAFSDALDARLGGDVLEDE